MSYDIYVTEYDTSFFELVKLGLQPTEIYNLLLTDYYYLILMLRVEKLNELRSYIYQLKKCEDYK